MTIWEESPKMGPRRASKKKTSSDDLAKELIDIMTRRLTTQLEDFSTGRRHKPPCICWLCLWRRFEKRLPAGAPYDYKTFLAYDIMAEIASPFELEAPLKGISTGRLAREVVRRLPIISAETKRMLGDFSRDLYAAHFKEYGYRGRYRAPKLEALMEELRLEIHRDWLKTKPVPVAVVDPRRQTAAELALKIARFVYSRPGRRATQREVQRHTNKTRAELEGLHAWLEWRYGIILPAREKWESTVYVGTGTK